ncbi:calcium-binding protein [Microvirga pudoricolor]|uniref:calcium-binding protein n=1 Tax=Microvirga pudoricolor TaxID=2778729 RepID=UPI00195267D0|nr:calcium-binding protein [Microvirga pudoricolor]MBM6593214.1 hypothetical protein [Microvirga pudoricolor]
MANVQFYSNMPAGIRLRDLFVAPTNVQINNAATQATIQEKVYDSLEVQVIYRGVNLTAPNGGNVSELQFSATGANWITYASSGSDGFSYAGDLWRFHAAGSFAAAIAMNGNDSITGSPNGDYMDGYAGNDTLNGGAGEDTMEGGAGDDLYYVDLSTDRVFDYPGQGYDTIITWANYALAEQSEIERLQAAVGTAPLSLTGNAFGSYIIGNDGDNTLNDGGGVSILQGGWGNDTYIVQNAATQVIEGIGQGDDIILASVSYSLNDGNDIARMSAAGIGPVDLTGNSLSNTLTGNAGRNTLYGLDGNDTIYGAEGHDKLFGGNGADRLYGGPGNDTVDGGAGNDWLYGDIGKDKLYGRDGNDRLFGGTGNDTIDGGKGNDILYGDMGNDKLCGGDGNDKLYGGLGDNTLSGGNGKDTLYGSYHRDLLKGDNGNDRLNGDGGNDTLHGGAGNDTLSGGKDSDVFVFDTKLNGRTNVDVITDFNPGQDTIWLKASVFGGIGGQGQLSPDAFWTGAQAHDATDRIIYNKDAGVLFFDPDGTGGAAPVAFAIVGNVNLSHSSFWIV